MTHLNRCEGSAIFRSQKLVLLICGKSMLDIVASANVHAAHGAEHLVAMEPDARKRQVMIWYVVAAMFGILPFQQFWSSYSQVDTISYTKFETLLNQNKVANVTVGANSIQGTLKAPFPMARPSSTPSASTRRFSTNSLPIRRRCAASSGVVQTILSWVVPIVIFYLIWMFCFAVRRSSFHDVQ